MTLLEVAGKDILLIVMLVLAVEVFLFFVFVLLVDVMDDDFIDDFLFIHSFRRSKLFFLRTQMNDHWKLEEQFIQKKQGVILCENINE